MNTNACAGRDSDKFMLRLPDGMRPWIAEEAKRSQRSMNAQIVWMLHQMVERIRAEAARAAS